MKNKIHITPRICVCDTHEYTHEKSFSELTFQNIILNLRLSHLQLEELKKVLKIKILEQEVILDFEAMTASYGWTTNPLYTFKHEDMFITEVSIYNFKELFTHLNKHDIAQLINLFTHDNIEIQYEIENLDEMKLSFDEKLLMKKEVFLNNEFKPINQYLKTWLDKDFSHINIEARKSFSIFFQYVIGGEFFEIEQHLEAGNHKIKLEHKPSHYFGICFNMPLNDFIDYDHKHILYGQIGVSSVKLLNYNNHLYHAYLSDKFLYKQCLNIINQPQQLSSYNINHKDFNFIDYYFDFSLINQKFKTSLQQYIIPLLLNINDKISLSFDIKTEEVFNEFKNIIKSMNNKINNIYFYLTVDLNQNIQEEISRCLSIEKEINQSFLNANIIYKTNMAFSLFNEELKEHINKLKMNLKDNSFQQFFRLKNFIEKLWLNNNVNTNENFYEILQKEKHTYYGFSYVRPIVEITEVSIQKSIIDNQKRLVKGCMQCPFHNNTCQYALSFPHDKVKTNYIYFNNGLTTEDCHYKKIIELFKN